MRLEQDEDYAIRQVLKSIMGLFDNITANISYVVQLKFHFNSLLVILGTMFNFTCIIAIWLILPVVIRLSQRLSHACLSINKSIRETANGSLYQL